MKNIILFFLLFSKARRLTFEKPKFIVYWLGTEARNMSEKIYI